MNVDMTLQGVYPNGVSLPEPPADDSWVVFGLSGFKGNDAFQPILRLVPALVKATERNKLTNEQAEKVGRLLGDVIDLISGGVTVGEVVKLIEDFKL